MEKSTALKSDADLCSNSNTQREGGRALPDTPWEPEKDQIILPLVLLSQFCQGLRSSLDSPVLTRLLSISNAGCWQPAEVAHAW